MGMRIQGNQANWSVQSQSQTVGDWQKRQAGLKSVMSALQSNDLASAQKAFDGLNVDTTKLDANSPLAKLGAALQSGDIASAQQAAQGLGHRHHKIQNTQSTNATQATSDPAFVQMVAQSLLSAINNTQTNNSPSTTSTGQSTQAVTGTQDVNKALTAFMQNLMSALEQTNTGDTSASTNAATSTSATTQSFAANMPPPPPSSGMNDPDGDGDNDGGGFAQSLSLANTLQGPPSPRFNNYMQAMGGQMKTNIDNLLQQLTTANASTSTGTGTATTANDLQSSFASFMSALGGQGDSSTLTSFLKNMQQNLQYGSTSGNLLNISA